MVEVISAPMWEKSGDAPRIGVRRSAGSGPRSLRASAARLDAPRPPPPAMHPASAFHCTRPDAALAAADDATPLCSAASDAAVMTSTIRLLKMQIIISLHDNSIRAS